MVTIKGWVDRKDLYIVCKGCDHITFRTAMMLIESAKFGPTKGHVRMTNSDVRFQYNRYPDGRIIIEQMT